MIVDDFIKNKRDTMPEGFYEVLPCICTEPDCEFPLVMTELLTGIQCSNPFCPNKVSYRIFMLLKDIGVDYVDESQVHDFVIEHKCKNMFEIFLYDFDREGLFSPTLSDILSKSLSSTLKQNNLFNVEEYMSVAHLPYMQGLIRPLFNSCTSLSDFYDKLEEEGIAYIQHLLDREQTEISVELMKIYEVLITYKEELLTGLDYVSIL